MRGRTIKFAAVATAAALTLAACGEDGADNSSSEPVEDEAVAAEEVEAPGTIVDVAVGAGSFETLVAAVQAAGLVETLSGDTQFTVFAPTDDAFAAALDSLGITAEELLGDTETLTSILTYHVVPGVVPSSDVVTLDGQSVATVNGAEVMISVDGSTVMVDGATVVAVDVEASNGVIHVIDSVLLPPAPEAAEEMTEESMEPESMVGTIVEVASDAGAFNTLLAAAEAAGLVETLSGDAPLTVFAPTDDAFATALEALGLTAEELLADTETLGSILTYHVVAGEVDAATAISLDGQSAPTVNGAEINISVVDGMVMINDATVVQPDVEASNGIIHVIDSVLLPAG